MKEEMKVVLKICLQTTATSVKYVYRSTSSALPPPPPKFPGSERFIHKVLAVIDHLSNHYL